MSPYITIEMRKEVKFNGGWFFTRPLSKDEFIFWTAFLHILSLMPNIYVISYSNVYITLLFSTKNIYPRGESNPGLRLENAESCH